MRTADLSPVLGGRLLLAAALAASAFACLPGGADENAVRRGDEAFARDSLEQALAEYRLAVAQGGEEPELLARVGHAYVALGRVDEAADYFQRAGLREPRWGDMGVADLVHLARNAAQRNDRFQMASAMEAARRLSPGLSAPDLTLPLARNYLRIGEYGKALPLYQMALAEASTPTPAVVFEAGQAYEQIGDCRTALLHFDRFRDLTPPREHAQADWYIGNCSFRLAGEIRGRSGGAAADLRQALRHVDRAIEVGEPQGLMGQAWLERGEILSLLGDCEATLQAFLTVASFEGPNTQTLRVRAQRRYDEVLIGRGLVGIRGRGCG
jgi:tetratricopeptide (TPR) repeat protein